MTDDLDEALAFIRAEADRHRAEVKAEYRRHAKTVWRDLGLRRPLDAQDAEELLALVRSGMESIARTLRAVARACAPFLRRLGEATGGDLGAPPAGDRQVVRVPPEKSA